MTLAAALLPLLPGGAGVIAFVGAGGKTSALFHLGAELVTEGRRVLLTSTTHLMDPRGEAARPPLTLVLRPELEAPPGACELPEAVPGLTVLMARPAGEPGKLKGVHPAWIPALKASWDFVLVEADGSRRLPLKAPADHEPVLPPGTDLVVGVVGLRSLGQSLDGRTVHRPERFGELTGGAPGAPITWDHVVALARHPQGLFKDAPGPRVMLLNQADQTTTLPTVSQLAELPADRVLLTTLAPTVRILACGSGRRP